MKKVKPACPERTAVAYARYSSAGQRDVSIDQQLADIRAFASREGYTIVHEFADHARSGYKNASSRTEFQAMLADAASGSFDTVLAWKVDRFGRSREQSAISKAALRRLGVSVVYVMERIPEGAAGVLTEGMLEALAEWYSTNLSENVTRGMNDNARRCLYNGTRILGYTRGPDNHYAVVPEEAAVVRRIFARYIAGWSAASVCGELNAEGLKTSHGRIWKPQSVIRVISNERYAGIYIWGDIRVPDGMPAIVSHKEWEEAQRMKRKTTRHLETRTVDYLLTGKAFCGHCGRAMIGDSGTSHTGAVYNYYACQGHKSRTGCAKKNVRKDVLENYVIDFILEKVLTGPERERIADAVMHEIEEREKKSPLAAMEKELAAVQKKIDNINDAIAEGIWNASTSARLKELEDTAENLRADIALHRYSYAQLVDRDRVMFFLDRFAKTDRNNPEDLRLLIRTFINAVYVYDDHLLILINAVEGSTAVPLADLPDPPSGSEIVSSGVLLQTHPNQIIFWYISRM